MSVAISSPMTDDGTGKERSKWPKQARPFSIQGARERSIMIAQGDEAETHWLA